MSLRVALFKFFIQKLSRNNLRSKVKQVILRECYTTNIPPKFALGFVEATLGNPGWGNLSYERRGENRTSFLVNDFTHPCLKTNTFLVSCL